MRQRRGRRETGVGFAGLTSHVHPALHERARRAAPVQSVAEAVAEAAAGVVAGAAAWAVAETVAEAVKDAVTEAAALGSGLQLNTEPS